MTEAKIKKRPSYANDPYFERWILHDAWDGFWYNLPIVLLAFLAMALIGVASPTDLVETAQTAKAKGFYIKVAPPMSVVSALTSFASILVSSLLVYAVHSTLLDNRPCWAAFSSEQRSKLFEFLKRVAVVVLTYLVVTSVQQLVFWQVAMQNGAPSEDNFGAVIFALVSVPALISLFVFGLLIVSWPGSVFLNGDQSFRRAIARGKKTFWFVIGKSLMVFPALLPVQLVMLAIILPMMHSLFLGGTSASITSVENLSFGALFTISLLNSVYFAMCSCIAGVIFSRALLVGEARLNGVSDQGGTEAKVAAKAE